MLVRGRQFLNFFWMSEDEDGEDVDFEWRHLPSEAKASKPYNNKFKVFNSVGLKTKNPYNFFGSEKSKLKKNPKTNICITNFEISSIPAKEINIARFICLHFARQVSPPYVGGLRIPCFIQHVFKNRRLRHGPRQKILKNRASSEPSWSKASYEN